MFVPKAFKFSRTVAAQVPTGWHAGRYGIPDDIIAQVDRTTLWALVSTIEAFNASGFTDPYELYKHMHPSEVGTALGSGMGGTISMGKMFKDRRDEKEVQNDILQETCVFLSSIYAQGRELIVRLVSLIPLLAGSICCFSRRVDLSRFLWAHGRFPRNRWTTAH